MAGKQRKEKHSPPAPMSKWKPRFHQKPQPHRSGRKAANSENAPALTPDGARKVNAFFVFTSNKTSSWIGPGGLTGGRTSVGRFGFPSRMSAWWTAGLSVGIRALSGIRAAEPQARAEKIHGNPCKHEDEERKLYRPLPDAEGHLLHQVVEGVPPPPRGVRSPSRFSSETCSTALRPQGAVSSGTRPAPAQTGGPPPA